MKGNHLLKKNGVVKRILMKMKISTLYEHLRKHDIISLPNKSTLKHYLRLYKSMFGFRKVLN